MKNIIIKKMDCIEFMKSLEENSIDLIITSPPYNLKNKGGQFIMNSYEDNMDNDDYEKWQIEFLNQCYRILKNEGAIFYNHKNRYENNEVICPLKWIFQTKLKLNQIIIWNRKNVCDYNNSKFAPLDENVFWLYKDSTFKLKKGAQNFTNIWEIDRPNWKEKLGHKATFPPMLIYRIINSLNIETSNLKIYDPFLGTGTTISVAKQFNFKEYLGTEISDYWIKIAEKKIDRIYKFYEEIPTIKKAYQKKETKKTLNQEQLKMFDLN